MTFLKMAFATMQKGGMMNELINRQAVLKALDEIAWEIKDGNGFQYEKWEEYFTELPSAQPNLQPTCNQLATDCISRQAAIDALHGYFDGMLETDTWSPCDVYGLIEILPSAQPEIIRCRECKHYDGRPCGIVDWYNTADDFCSRAERREE